MLAAMDWSGFESAAPELAAFGRERLNGRVAYLATTRPDGGPRVHPVTPIVGDGRAFLFMEPTSPKGKDLDRDGRFALHCAVEGTDGGAGEFLLSGTVERHHDTDSRAAATAAASYEPAARHILFELFPTYAQRTTYGDSGPVRREWRAR